MNKKSLIIIGCSIIGVIIVILLVLWLITLFKGRYITYEKLEEKMVEATKDYYKTYPERLPSQNGKSTLSYDSLVEAEKIKPLNELLKDGDTCSAEVEVFKNDNDYNYLPRLTCSDKYSTKTLVDQILASNDIVNQGSGLYKDNNEYYFRGKITNNYVLFGNNETDKKGIAWQIISIDQDNNIKLKALGKTDRISFDTRYNVDKDTNYGYNTFENSEFEDYIKKLENEEVFLNQEAKTRLVKSKLCVGKRTLNDKTKDGSTECATLTSNSYLFSTLLPYEYIRASLDNNCNTVQDKSCSNLNFIASLNDANSSSSYYSSSWTITPDADTSFKLYTYDASGFSLSNASNEKIFYPVVKLNSFTQFKSGDGTQTNPYILK